MNCPSHGQTRTGASEWVSTSAFVLARFALGRPGCQQKMAEQPYYRPYTSRRIVRGRPLEPAAGTGRDPPRPAPRIDPIVTGLTREEWGRLYALGAEPQSSTSAIKPSRRTARSPIGAPRFDPREPGKPRSVRRRVPVRDHRGRPEERAGAVHDLLRGLPRPLGNGQGKIWERGYLKPTSFHTAGCERARVSW